MKFFEPDEDFLIWIKNYAKDRLIIDCGAGQGHIARELYKLGHKKIVAFEYIGDHMNFQKENLKQGLGMIQYLVDDCTKSNITSLPNILLLFCRPCHSNFVEKTIQHMDHTSEVLYITKPDNLKEYNDLGNYRNKAIEIKHIGSSLEGEKVWSIRK